LKKLAGFSSVFPWRISKCKWVPVVKIESLANNEDDVNIDTTKEADIVPEIAEETKTDIVSSEEVK
jgi:hypothetical protein